MLAVSRDLHSEGLECPEPNGAQLGHGDVVAEVEVVVHHLHHLLHDVDGAERLAHCEWVLMGPTVWRVSVDCYLALVCETSTSISSSLTPPSSSR